MNAKEAPARSLYVLYWQSVFNPMWRNNFTSEIKRLAERSKIEEARRQRGFDFLMINLNPYSPDFERYKSLIQKYRGQKLQGLPLIILDKGNDFLVIKSSSHLNQLEH